MNSYLHEQYFAPKFREWLVDNSIALGLVIILPLLLNKNIYGGIRFSVIFFSAYVGFQIALCALHYNSVCLNKSEIRISRLFGVSQIIKIKDIREREFREMPVSGFSPFSAIILSSQDKTAIIYKSYISDEDYKQLKSSLRAS